MEIKVGQVWQNDKDEKFYIKEVCNRHSINSRVFFVSLQNTDEYDELYDKNQQLFDSVLDNEEDSVEEFAWCFYDNDLNTSDLYKILNLYYKLYNNIDESLTKVQIS